MRSPAHVPKSDSHRYLVIRNVPSRAYSCIIILPDYPSRTAIYHGLFVPKPKVRIVASISIRIEQCFTLIILCVTLNVGCDVVIVSHPKPRNQSSQSLRQLAHSARIELCVWSWNRWFRILRCGIGLVLTRRHDVGDRRTVAARKKTWI